MRKIVRQVNIEVDVEERMLEHAKIVALRLRVRTLRDMEVCRTLVILLLVRIVQRVSTKTAVAEPVREPARRVRTRHLDSTTHLMVVDPTVVPYLIARRLVQLGNIAAVAPVRVQVRVLRVQGFLQISTGLRPEVLRIRVVSNHAIHPRVVLVTISLVVLVRSVVSLVSYCNSIDSITLLSLIHIA